VLRICAASLRTLMDPIGHPHSTLLHGVHSTTEGHLGVYLLLWGWGCSEGEGERAAPGRGIEGWDTPPRYTPGPRCVKRGFPTLCGQQESQQCTASLLTPLIPTDAPTTRLSCEQAAHFRRDANPLHGRICHPLHGLADASQRAAVHFKGVIGYACRPMLPTLHLTRFSLSASGATPQAAQPPGMAKKGL
jgi:hypothetical protein